MTLAAGWKVELGIGDADDLADVGLYDTARYDETDVYGSSDEFGYLVDATNLCESISTKTGRDRFTSRFRTGTAQLVFDDTSGVFTPPAGVAPPLGLLPLRPGRTVRVSYKEATVFSGVIDSLDSRTPRDGNVLSVIRAVDSFAGFNRNDIVAITPEGAGDTTPERMMRLLDRYLGDDAPLFVFQGDPFATLQATAMGQNLLTELQLTADSEGGGCWINPSGDIVASGFSYFSDKVDGDVDYQVGGASPIKIWSSDSDWEMIRILNEAHYSRVGGVEQIRVAVLSQDTFGRRTHTRLDLVNDDDTQVAVLAQRVVDFAGVDRQRLTEIRFLPEPDTATAAMAVTATFGDVFLVTIDTLYDWSYAVKTQLFGIEHTVTDRWLCTFRTDDTLFATQEFAFERASYDNEAFS